MHIPNDIRKIQDIVVLDGKPDVEYVFVVVVEKYSMLNYLQQMDFHNKNNCIIMTNFLNSRL